VNLDFANEQIVIREIARGRRHGDGRRATHRAEIAATESALPVALGAGARGERRQTQRREMPPPTSDLKTTHCRPSLSPRLSLCRAQRQTLIRERAQTRRQSRITHSGKSNAAQTRPATGPPCACSLSPRCP
jgi:hypothetical protein